MHPAAIDFDPEFFSDGDTDLCRRIETRKRLNDEELLRLGQ
jgi:hypothetical protein